MDSKINFFIQVRMGSTRFPEKVLRKFSSGKNTLDIMISTLKRSKFFSGDNIIVLTSMNSKDDILEFYCEQNNLTCFRGDENNVLQRFFDASQKYHSEYIVRICGDNPFLQCSLLDTLLGVAAKELGTDYYSFQKADETPAILTHYGFFSEVIKTSAIEKAVTFTDDPVDLEHVTRVFYLNRDAFKCHFTPMPEIIDQSNIRLTFDTPEDFKVIDHILSEFADDDVPYEKLIPYLNKNEQLLEQMKRNIQENSK